jgi:hypothetical protein
MGTGGYKITDHGAVLLSNILKTYNIVTYKTTL